MTFTIDGNKYRIAYRVGIVATVLKDKEPEAVCRILGEGTAICHTVDNFDPAEGAKLATTRALQYAIPEVEKRAEVWKQIKGKVEHEGEKVVASAANAIIDECLGF